MKYIIVGGSGFVGSSLISVLKPENCQNFDKKVSPFFSEISTLVDIRNKDELNFNKEASCVVLLAAEHRDDVSPTSLYYDVNVKGTKNVLDEMDKHGIKNLIFTSSVAIYGLNKINPNEDNLSDPFNHYGKSKLEAESLIKNWFENDPIKKSVTILRPTVIFGERNRGNVYNLLKQIASGKFMMIGNGVNKKSMAYVGNIVAFIKDRLEFNQEGCNIYNYVDNPDLTMSELSQLIEEKMNIKIPSQKIPYWVGMIIGYLCELFSLFFYKKILISSVRVKKFHSTTQFDASKAHSLFNAPFTLEEGLNRTLDHEFIDPKKDEILFYSE